MQRNRGRNNPLDSRNPLIFAQENAMSEELETMLLQRNQMLLNLPLDQGLMSSPVQNIQLQSQALPTSLFPSLNNILPGTGVLSTLLPTSSVDTRPNLVPNPFISGPSMVPPPKSVPSTTQSGSSLNRNSVFNASGKNIFASKNDSQFHNSRETDGSSRSRSSNLDQKWTNSERFSDKTSFDISRKWGRDREENQESNERSWCSERGEMPSSSKNTLYNQSLIKDIDRWKPNVRDDEKLFQRSFDDMRWSSKDRSDEKRWNDWNIENKIECRSQDESRSKRSRDDEQNRNNEEYRTYQEHWGDNWNKKAKFSNDRWNQTRDQVAWDKKSNESECSSSLSVEPSNEWSSSKDCEKKMWSNESKNSNENLWKLPSREPNWSRHDETSWSGRSPEPDEKHWKSNYSMVNDTPSSSYSSYEDTRFSKNNDFENQRKYNKETNKNQDRKWSNDNNVKEFDASVWALKPKKESDQSWEKDKGQRSDERSGRSAQHQSWFEKEHKTLQGKSFDRDRKMYEDNIRNVSTTKIRGEKVSETSRNFLYPDPDQQVKDVWSGFNNAENVYNVTKDTPIERDHQLSVLNNEQSIRSLQEEKDAEHLYMMMMKFKQQKEMEEKMVYLDSRLEQLDERMLQISDPLTERPQEKVIPEVWDFPIPHMNSVKEREMNKDSGNADLRLKLMSKKDRKGSKIDIADSSGGWGEDMVVVCPVNRSNRLTMTDVSVLKVQLSNQIHKLLDSNSQDVQPRILGSKMVCNGWFLIHCGDEETLAWVLSWTPPRPVKSRYPIKIRKASDAARLFVISILLKDIKDRDFKKIRFRLLNQNFHADSKTWDQVPNPVVTSSGTEIKFFVDRHCLNLLEKNSWKVFYDLGCYRATLVENKDIIPLKVVK